MRFFNTAGPCVAEDHYMLPASARLPGVRRLVDRRSGLAPISERTSATEMTSPGGRTITVIRG